MSLAGIVKKTLVNYAPERSELVTFKEPDIAWNF